MVNLLSQNRFKSSVLVYGLSPFDQNAVWSTMLLIKREINYIALQIRRVNIWFLSPTTTIYGGFGVLLQKTYIIWLSNLLTLIVLDEKVITETCRVQISTFVFVFDTL